MTVMREGHNDEEARLLHKTNSKVDIIPDPEKGTTENQDPAKGGSSASDVSPFLIVGLLALVIATQTVKDVYRTVTLKELLHNATIFAMLTCVISMILEFGMVWKNEGRAGLRELYKGIPYWNMENLKAFGPCAPLFSLQKVPDTLAAVFILPGLAGVVKQVNPLITNALTPIIVGRTSSAKEWTAIVGIVCTVLCFGYISAGDQGVGGASPLLGAVLIVIGRTLGAVGGLVSEKSMKKGGKKSVYMQKFWMDCCELPSAIIFFFLMPYILAPVDWLAISETKLAEKEDYSILQAQYLTITKPDAAIERYIKSTAGTSKANVDQLVNELKTVCGASQDENEANLLCKEAVVKSFKARHDLSALRPLKETQALLNDLVKKVTAFPIKPVTAKIKENNYMHITLGAENGMNWPAGADPRQVFKKVTETLWCVENSAAVKKEMKQTQDAIAHYKKNGDEKKLLPQTPAKEGSAIAPTDDKAVIKQLEERLKSLKKPMHKRFELSPEHGGLKNFVGKNCGNFVMAKPDGLGWSIAQVNSKTGNSDKRYADFVQGGLVDILVDGTNFEEAMKKMMEDDRQKQDPATARKISPKPVTFKHDRLVNASLQWGDFNTGSQLDGSADTFVCAVDRCNIQELEKQYKYMDDKLAKWQKSGAIKTGTLSDYASGAFLNIFCFAMLLNAAINAVSNLVGAAITKQLSSVWKALGQTLATLVTFWTFDFFFHSAESGFYVASGQQIMALGAVTVLMLVNTIFFATAKTPGAH